jgi:hypothetical protein
VLTTVLLTLASPLPTIQQSAELVTLELGIDAMLPGSDVYVPIRLQGQPAAAVGKIQLSILFPSEILLFQGAEERSESALGNLEVSLREPTPEESAREPPAASGVIRGPRKILEITLASANALHAGTLAQLAFKCVERETLPPQVHLRNLNPRAFSLDGDELATRGTDGVISLIAVPVFGCFFYMH